MLGANRWCGDTKPAEECVMNEKSYRKFFVGTLGAGLLITNCTIKNASDDGAAGNGSGTCTPGSKITGCTCTGNVVGSQTCLADGTYAACSCATSSDGGSGGAAAGGATVTGGASSTGGASGGASGAGEAGAGDSGIDPTDCEGCLATLCTTQWQACEADPVCLSAMTDGTGQYEEIIACINKARASGLVKRDVVRGCGVSIGESAEPDYSPWAPPSMAQTTTDLMNCMADAPGTPTAQAGAWANDDTNYPVDDMDVIQPAPWPAGTCAKLACTSAIPK